MSVIGQQTAINGSIANSPLYQTSSVNGTSTNLSNDKTAEPISSVADTIEISKESSAAWESYLLTMEAGEANTTNNGINSQYTFAEKLNDVLASLVSDGTLTREQANKIKSLLISSEIKTAPQLPTPPQVSEKYDDYETKTTDQSLEGATEKGANSDETASINNLAASSRSSEEKVDAVGEVINFVGDEMAALQSTEKTTEDELNSILLSLIRSDD